MAAYSNYNYNNNSSRLLSFTFLIVFIIGNTNGFTVDLIHRDSPESPLYDNTTETTPFQQVNNALRRSIERANHFFPRNAAEFGESEIVSVEGEYVMAYSLGTPPVKTFGIADTGSDLVWLQCEPCQSCFKQTAPLFNPSKSRTYKTVPCSSNQCKSASLSVGRTSCAATGCRYDIQYGDYSTSSGDIASDTLTLGQVAFPRTVFGCGFSNGGTFRPQTSGIVGLGRGSVSLVSQMGSASEGKFSYCLVPFFSRKLSSKMSFGRNAVVSGRGTVSTPMVFKARGTFYHLTLEGMSVGATRLEFNAGGSVLEEGNIIIDSGTTLTLLPVEFYSKLESEVARHISLRRVEDPQKTLSLCYSTNSLTIKAPIITVHFRGADVNLNPLNTFVKVSPDTSCFAFSPNPSGSIFGNLAQMNFLVGYDIRKGLVSFTPTDCTKF